MDPSMNSCRGDLLLSEERVWLFQLSLNSKRDLFMRGRITKLRQNKSTSFRESSFSLLSRDLKVVVKTLAIHLWTSLHSRSILWLCTELPVITVV